MLERKEKRQAMENNLSPINMSGVFKPEICKNFKLITSRLFWNRNCFMFLIFFNVYLFFKRDREQEMGRERRGQRIQSRLCTDSIEPDVGPEFTNCEIMTRAKGRRSTNWPTQAPLETVFLIPFLKEFVLLLLKYSTSFIKNKIYRGTWVPQSVERPTSAQVMISQFVDSSPVSGPVLTAESLKSASDSGSPSLSALPC